MSENTGKFMSQAEATTILGKTLASIGNLIKRGRLRTHNKYGRKVLYAKDVFAYVQGKPGRKPGSKIEVQKLRRCVPGLQRRNGGHTVENAGMFVTQTEAATILGKSLHVIHNLMRRGRLRAHNKYGRKVLYAKDVFAYVQRKPGRPRKLAVQNINEVRMEATTAAAVGKERGECSSCSTGDVVLVGVSSKNGGKICDACLTEIRQGGLVFDQYDLRPGELTKEQFADKAGVSLRAVEGWKKDGKIEAQKLRRRVGGVVRKQLIFKAEDVEQFLNGANEVVNIPAIEKPDALQRRNGSHAGGGDALGMIAEYLIRTSPQISAGSVVKFLTVAAASDEYGLAQNEIRHLIRDGALKGFRGKNGEILVSRKQIEDL